MSDAWKRCSTCKNEIPFGATYYVCSVSTCNRKRTGMTFCKVECWDQHLPMMRHREAWAVEEKAPTREQWNQEQAASGSSKPASQASSRDDARGSSAPVRRRVVGRKVPEPPAGPREVLVVASRLKSYIKAAYDMNTSDAVLDVLSDHLRRLTVEAADAAREEGRKTILDRDFDFLNKG